MGWRAQSFSLRRRKGCALFDLLKKKKQRKVKRMFVRSSVKKKTSEKHSVALS